MTQLKAGMSKIDITPPVGIELCPYDSIKSKEVLDNLYATALILDDGNTRVAIITADLLGIARKYVEEVRSDIEKETGMKKENILICASHTHSGPATLFLRDWGKIDEEYIATLKKKLTQVTCVAAKSMFDARIGMGHGKVDSISSNRHIRMKDGTIKMDWEDFSNSEASGPAWPMDPEVGVIRIDNNKGEMLAVIVNFGCHPVTMHSYKGMISADFPGYARKVLEKEGITLLYTSGLLGDVNPIGFRDNRGPDFAKRCGEILGREVLRVARQIKTTPEVHLAVISENVELPLKRPPFFSEDTNNRLSLSAEIQIIKVNELTLIAVPFEVFTEIGMDIKRKSNSEYTFIVGLANGVFGYLPTAKVFKDKGDYIYEIAETGAPFHHGFYLTSQAEEIVKSKILQQLS